MIKKNNQIKKKIKNNNKIKIEIKKEEVKGNWEKKKNTNQMILINQKIICKLKKLKKLQQIQKSNKYIYYIIRRKKKVNPVPHHHPHHLPHHLLLIQNPRQIVVLRHPLKNENDFLSLFFINFLKSTENEMDKQLSIFE